MTRSQPPKLPNASGQGCEAFAEAAVLRVDRELGPAEAAALDAHLAACPSCRLKAAQAEALSTLLKEWDAERGGRAHAPARLRLKIRTMAVEQGRWRRREVRLVRRLRLATAASVLFALGAGLFLGLLSMESMGAPDVTGERLVAGLDRPVPVPGPQARPLPVPHIAEVEVAPSRLAALDVGGGEPAWLTARERVRVLRHLTRSEAMTLQREAFEARAGGKAVWEKDPETGTLRLITFAQKRFGGSTPVIQPTAPPIASRESPTVADDNAPVDTNRRIGDFLRLPGRRSDLDRVLSGRPVPLKNPGGRFGSVVFLPRPREGSRWRGRVSDLERATGEGTLLLHEGHDDNLVAITKDLRWPVFIPAGELIQGGSVDRVVMEGVWIQPSSAVPTVVPCAPAGTPGASLGGPLAATGHMAGPKLRSFLAQRPLPEEVRTWISKHLPIREERGHDFSLLSWYRRDLLDENLERLVGPLMRAEARGFVVSDIQGHLVSVETTELPPEVAAVLITRLVTGYLVESAVAWERARMRGVSGVSAGRTGGRETALALLSLMGAEATFQHPKTGGHRVRVLRMTEPTTQAVADVVERLPQGTGVLTSVFLP